jgi:hypothetical protein
MALRESNGGGTPRQVFGAVVRFYRERAGLSRPDLAGRIHKSVSLIESIERGDRVATGDVTADLEDVADLNTAGILTMLRDKFGSSMSYNALPVWFEDWAGHERVAVRLRWFEPLVVPGLLQTEAYARSLLTGRIGKQPEDAEALVRARMDRQAVLTRAGDPAEFLAVLDEGVLRRGVGGATVMAEQVKHLVEASGWPNVVVQVIPAATAVHDGVNGGGFAIADFEDGPGVGYQETALRGVPLTDPKDVAGLAVVFDRLRAEALPRAASLALLEEAATTWSQAV